MAGIEVKSQALTTDAATGQQSLTYSGTARLRTIDQLTHTVMRNSIDTLGEIIDCLKARVYEDGYEYVDHVVDAFTQLATTDASAQYAFVIRVQVTVNNKMLRTDAEWNF